MLHNACIIILCNVPWEWSTDYINQTAVELAKKNTVICFFWFEALSYKEYFLKRQRPIFFKKYQKRIYFYSGAHFLPFRRYQLLATCNLAINIMIIRLGVMVLSLREKFSAFYIWSFDPRLFYMTKYFSPTYQSIYDCVDYWSGADNLTYREREVVRQTEKEVIRHADVVVVNSHTLYKMHEKIRKDIHLVPQGFRLGVFRHYKKSSVQFPTDTPIVGYVGAINERLDYPLLMKLIGSLRRYRFVFVGPRVNSNTTDIARLLTLPNVMYAGNIPKDELPDVIAQFGVGIIPYRTNTLFNRYAFPMKLFEYFYMGKPVVSAPIEELYRFSRYVKVGTTSRQWEKHITTLLSHPWPQKYKNQQKQLAVENNWEEKIDKINILVFKSDQQEHR